LRIVFMGSPQAVVPVLESLVANKHDVAAVYTLPDRPAGRGRVAAAPPVKQAAVRLGLDVRQVSILKGDETLIQLAACQADAIVLAAFGLLVQPAVLDLFRYGCLNIHPSLLPKYRGAAPVAAAILAGDEFAGVSIMKLDAGLDSGPLFVQAQVAISPFDTTGSLTDRLFQVGAGLLLEVLAQLPGGNLRPRPQDPEGSSYFPELEKAAGKIDWTLPAQSIARRIRAFQPWPGAYTLWQGRQVKIVEAHPLATRTEAGPGRVISPPRSGATGADLAVGTGQGLLAITKLQMEGKRALSGEEFLRGQKGFEGALLE
jgi:methionyl-tRNA formyltransferase